MKKSKEAWKEYQDFKNKVTGGKNVNGDYRGYPKEDVEKLRRLYRISKTLEQGGE